MKRKKRKRMTKRRRKMKNEKKRKRIRRKNKMKRIEIRKDQMMTKRSMCLLYFCCILVINLSI